MRIDKITIEPIGEVRDDDIGPEHADGGYGGEYSPGEQPGADRYRVRVFRRDKNDREKYDELLSRAVEVVQVEGNEIETDGLMALERNGGQTLDASFTTRMSAGLRADIDVTDGGCNHPTIGIEQV